MSEPPSLPEMHKLADPYGRPDGYLWLIRPDAPSILGIFGGGGDARVLVCERCGAMVGLTPQHNEWHEAIS